ncbi:hypothetical protein ACVWXN_006039 [Bradyrhizobium sp. i1.4.4]
MPRISKGPRLYKRKAKRRNGRLIANAVWTIRDGDREVATGIFAGEAERKPPKAAEDALVTYITSKYRPPRRVRDIEDIDVADVLAIYHAHRETIYIERGSPQSEITEFADRIGRLNDSFGGKMLAEVNAQTCGQYVKARGRPGGARRDLEDLRAAINHHAREGLHRGLVRVALPAKGPGRERWLSRSEAAALLWACWQYREVQTRHRGPLKNQKIETGKRPLRHIARFILIGLYTGTRAGAIASASPYRDTGRSYVDLENGIFYRLAQGRRPTKKRQPPAPIPDRLLAHMRRWVRTGAIVSHFVEFNGRGDQIRQVGVPKRRRTRQAVHRSGQGHAAHLEAHGCDLVDAAWRRSVEIGGLSWDVGRGAARYLWPPPPGILARGGRGHHDETKQEHRIWG